MYIVDDHGFCTCTHKVKMPFDPAKLENFIWITRICKGFCASYDTCLNISDSFLNIGQYNTTLGDLFISNNGWNPYGPAKYIEDYYVNGG